MGPHDCIFLASLMKSHIFLTTIHGEDSEDDDEDYEDDDEDSENDDEDSEDDDSEDDDEDFHSLAKKNYRSRRLFFSSALTGPFRP